MIELTKQKDLQEIGYQYALTEFWLKVANHMTEKIPELEMEKETEHARISFNSLQKALQTLEPEEYGYMLKGYDDMKRKIEKVFCVKSWQ